MITSQIATTLCKYWHMYCNFRKYTHSKTHGKRPYGKVWYSQNSVSGRVTAGTVKGKPAITSHLLIKPATMEADDTPKRPSISTNICGAALRFAERQ